jgi:hypothetical protein
MLPPMRDCERLLKLATTVALVSLALVASAFQVAKAELIALNGGCGWDGDMYCRMASGEVVWEPYSRRVLVPWLVGLVTRDDDPLPGFRVVNTVAIVALVVAACLLHHVLVDGRRDPWAWAGLASLVMLNPWTWHVHLTYPALTDVPAAAFVTLWAASVLRPGRWVDVGGLFALVGLALTREHWAAVAVIAALLAVPLGLRRARWAAVTTAVGVLCLTFVLSRPSSRDAGAFRAVFEAWFQESTSSPQHAARFGFMVATGLGLVAIVPFLRPRALMHRPTAWVCMLALGNFAVSVFAGGDTDRILMPSAVLLLCAGTAVVTRERRLLLPWSFLVFATVATWHPFATPGPDPGGWITFFGLRAADLGQVMVRIAGDVSAVSGLVIAALVAAWIPLGREPRTAATGSPGSADDVTGPIDSVHGRPGPDHADVRREPTRPSAR